MDPLPPAPNVDPASRPRARWVARLVHVKRPLVALAGIGAVLSGLAGWYNAVSTMRAAATRDGSTSETHASAAPAAASSATVPDAPLSIAVMPFVNLTGDAQKAYLADGLATSIATDLAQRIPETSIVPIATVLAYRDKGLTVQQLGQTFNVGYVLTGSVQGNGGALRVTTQLSDAHSGAQLWSRSFDGQAADAMAFQDHVTLEAVTGASTTMIAAAVKVADARKGPPTPAYLRLRARWLSMQPLSEESLRELVSIQRQLVVLQPSYVPTQGYLAANLRDYALTYETGDAKREQREKDLAEARAWATKASQADPDNYLACIDTGLFARDDGDVDVARRIFERCLRLRPRSTVVLNELAGTYMYDGIAGARQATALLEQAVEIEGAHPYGATQMNLGEARFATGDSAHAIEPLQLAVRIDPSLLEAQYMLAMVYADLGDAAHLAETQAKIAALKAASPKEPVPTFRDFDRNNGVNTPDYRALRDARLLPLWRKAGLPL